MQSKEYRKEYYKRNKEKINERKKIGYRANKERILAGQRAYRLKNAEKIKNRYWDNREIINERRKPYFEKYQERKRLLRAQQGGIKSTEKQKEWCRAYKANNREKIAAYNKEYHVKNKDKIKFKRKEKFEKRKSYNEKWREENKERYIQSTHIYHITHRREGAQRTAKRRAIEYGLKNHHTKQEWDKKIEEYDGKCFYCGKERLQLVRDHNIPLCRGGSDTIDNIFPACKECNLRKHKKTAEEFMKYKGVPNDFPPEH